MKICHLLALMSFTTCKTFVRLHNTDEDVFDEIGEFLSLHWPIYHIIWWWTDWIYAYGFRISF